MTFLSFFHWLKTSYYYFLIPQTRLDKWYCFVYALNKIKIIRFIIHDGDWWFFHYHHHCNSQSTFFLPRAVGDFDGGAIAVLASTSRGRAVTRPGATQAGADTIHTIIIVAGLPWRPGSEATVGGLVPQLENKHQPWREGDQVSRHQSGLFNHPAHEPVTAQGAAEVVK